MKLFDKLVLVIIFLAISSKSNSSKSIWDFDSNNNDDALTDGLLFLRYNFGLTGDSLTDGVVSEDSEITSFEIEQNLYNLVKNNSQIADIDGNGYIDALSDGLILFRYLFGMRGESLTRGSMHLSSKRVHSNEIEDYFERKFSISNNTIYEESDKQALIAKAKDTLNSLKIIISGTDNQSPKFTPIDKQIELAINFTSNDEIMSLRSAFGAVSKILDTAHMSNLDELDENQTYLQNYDYINEDGVITSVEIIEDTDGYNYNISSSISPKSDAIEVNYNLHAHINFEDIKINIGPSLEDFEWGPNNENSEVPINVPNFELDLNRNRPVIGEDQIIMEQTTTSSSLFIVTGNFSSDNYNLIIHNGEYEHEIYNDYSAWFAGQGAVEQYSQWDQDVPVSTPLMYREVENNNDLAIGLSQKADYELDIEIQKTNTDDPYLFTGTIGPFGEFNTHSLINMPSFNRTVTKAYFTEDFPILELGLDPNNQFTASDAVYGDYEDRPTYKNDMIITGAAGTQSVLIAGNLFSNNHSVNFSQSRSHQVQRDTWSGISEPGQLTDILGRTAIENNIENLSVAERSPRQVESFSVPFDELADIARRTYPVIEQDACEIDISEFGVNPTDPLFLQTGKKHNWCYPLPINETETEIEIDMSQNELFLTSNTKIGIEQLNVFFNYPEHLINIATSSDHLGFNVTTTDLLDVLILTGNKRHHLEQFLKNIYGSNYEDLPVDTNDRHAYYNFLFSQSRDDYRVKQLTINNQSGVEIIMLQHCPEILNSCDNLGYVKVDGVIVANISYDDVIDSFKVSYFDSSFTTL
jgi:hypothetical protein